MKGPALDLSRYHQFVSSLEQMAEHRRRHPTFPADQLYYELLAQYFRRAMDRENPVVAHSVLVPHELFLALDLVPLHLEGVAVISVPVLRDSEQTLSWAKSYGLPSEICSVHRAMTGMAVQGSLPADLVVTGHQICDSSYKSGRVLHELYSIPLYTLDRPYRYDERDVVYYAQELEELIAYLEGATGRRLDWDKLAQAMEYSRQMMELHREIYELRKLVPCPAPSRRALQLLFLGWLWTGTPQGVAFFQAVRDELWERAQRGVGVVPQERFRLLGVFPLPAHKWKLLDWMEREHGAVIVADPYCSRWGEFPWDDSRPLETLARKWFHTPLGRQMHGPASIGWLPDTVADAQSFQVQGALYWAAVGCPQGCALIRILKDALREQAGIPTLVLDVDVIDPSFVTEEELKDKLEGFFERLGEGE